MIFEQIRNATIILKYGGKKILIDPWLAPKDAMEPLRENRLGMDLYSPIEEKNNIPMPLVELPISIEAILDGIEINVNTHLHPDHMDIGPDNSVGELLNKEIPMVIRDDEDCIVFENSGFKNIHSLSKTVCIDGVRMIRTPAIHGTQIPCGEACGILFQHAEEPTVYLIGDTIWTDGVEETIKKYQPDIIIVNACAAEFINFGRLIMNDEDIKKIRVCAPNAKIIISHMDTVSHLMITRADMKAFLDKESLWENIYIPDDGENIVLDSSIFC